MQVHLRFEAGGASAIRTYTPTANKSYDSTLADTAMSMRKIADLQDGGFPLDGSHEWYTDKSPSDENGKLGLRSVAGYSVSVTITASSRLDSVTVSSTGVEYIEKGGTQYPSSGLDVIPINANTATLTFYPNDPNGRAFIKYIIPGAIFNITNENLINCNVALRSSLTADNPSWEESDIEVQFYYPYDISETLAYIQDDWPLTYEAGYSDEMSMLRKFYLSEPGKQEGNIVTLHAVDASSLMDERTLSERFIVNNNRNATVKELAQFMIDWIEGAGIQLARVSNNGSNVASSANVAILPEQSTRDAVMMFTNLTATLPEEYRLSFVDAGVPTVQVGEEFTNVWEIDEEDIAELVIETPRHVNRVVNTNEDHKFDEMNKPFSKTNVEAVEIQKEQTFERSFDTLVYSAYLTGFIKASPFGVETDWPVACAIIRLTPSSGYWRVNSPQNIVRAQLTTLPLLTSGGVNQYTDGTGLPGVPIEMDPPIYGEIKIGNVSIFSPKNLLNRPNKTITFQFKGDPRMQPRDFLQVNRLDGSRFRTRIASIETTHEGGGTMATVTAQITNLWKE